MIRLEAHDWLWATWREYTPKPKPKPTPFDRFIRTAQLHQQPHWHQWQKLIPKYPSVVEAHFWLEAIQLRFPAAHNYLLDPQFVEKISRIPLDGQVSLEHLREVIQRYPTLHAFEDACLKLGNALFPAHEYLPMLLTTLRETQPQRRFYLTTYQLFREISLPYLTLPERVALRSTLRPLIEATVNKYDATSSPRDLQEVVYQLELLLGAAVGGFSAEIERVMALMSDQPTTQNRGRYYLEISPLHVLFGLDDPTKLAREARRLGCMVAAADETTGWLAHTETHELEWVYQSLLHLGQDKEALLACFKVLAKVEAVAVVPYMLALQEQPHLGILAREWLTTHPAIALEGAAWALSGQHAEAAIAYLRLVKRRGVDFETVKQGLPPKIQDLLQRQVLDYEVVTLPPLDATTTPDWLQSAVIALQRQATNKKKAVSRVTWVDYYELPMLTFQQRPLTYEQGQAVLTALSQSTIQHRAPVLLDLKAHLPAVQVERFAWELFQLWLKRSGTAKEKWALYAVGFFGGDESALKLASYIRRWPGEAQHARAVTGLECLQLIGSDTALMQISSIAQKASFAGIRKAAQQAMTYIAQQRNLTEEQLLDRIVPDCGLDEHGKRLFDFGTRQFQFALDHDLNPVIRDMTGKLKADLPKATPQDDRDKAQQALADWKTLKKQIREVAKVQNARLELSLIRQRRWTVTEFETLIVAHPLLVHLTRRLIWGGYVGGQLVATFRFTEERDYANEQDDPLTLAPDWQIGLVHPLHLTAAELRAWQQLLHDYELIQPFEQLQRRVQHLEAHETPLLELQRTVGLQIESNALVGILQRLGWQRGSPEDYGVYYHFSKAFPQQKVVAILQTEGIHPSYGGMTQTTTLKTVYFTPQSTAADSMRCPLGEVDPIVMNEILRDVWVLIEKAR